jgi:hypothetical protein
MNQALPRFEEPAHLQPIAWFGHHDACGLQVVAFQLHPGRPLSITSPVAPTRVPRWATVLCHG